VLVEAFRKVSDEFAEIARESQQDEQPKE
jgi:hypothetical protein